MKQCSKCGEWKELNEFNKCRDRSGGLHSYCRDCNKKNLNKYYKENRDRLRKSQKEYIWSVKGRKTILAYKKTEKYKKIRKEGRRKWDKESYKRHGKEQNSRRIEIFNIRYNVNTCDERMKSMIEALIAIRHKKQILKEVNNG